MPTAIELLNSGAYDPYAGAPSGLDMRPAVPPVEVSAKALRARARSEAVKGREGSANRIRNGVYDFLRRRLDPETTTPIMAGMDMLPIIGDAGGVEDTYQAAKAGEWKKAGLLGGATALGMFLGPLAKTAKHADLAIAKGMLDKGVDAGRIWKDTGWFQGADGKWRFEIDDSAADLRPGASRQTSIKSGFEHPELYGAYEETAPFWGDLDIFETHPGNAAGAYNPDRGAISIQRDVGRSTMLHELQHAVQSREGFAFGSNTKVAADQLQRELSSKMDDYSARISELMKFSPDMAEKYRARNRALSAKDFDTVDALERELIGNASGRQLLDLDFARDSLHARKISDDDVVDRYRAHAGEVEARNVQKRRDMTPEERRATPPWETEDVPRDQQIVRFGAAGPQLSADPLELPPAAELLNEPPARPKIRAYHGSPHDFDAFSMDKIGTGEGAQAYGHGLYFAENDNVAESYKHAVSGRQAKHTFDGKPVETTEDWWGLEDQLNASGDWRQAKLLKEYAAKIEPDPALRFRQLRDWHRNSPEMMGAIDDLEKRVSTDVPKGHMYEVNINAAPDDFLDWDKPLSEQSEKVRAAVKERMIPSDDMKGPLKRRAEAAAAGDFSDIDGNSALALLGGYGKPEQATAALREAGIPGIRYLDQGSRTAGDGSRNYVVFDENLLEIVRKYGIAGLLAGGAALQGGGQRNNTKGGT